MSRQRDFLGETLFLEISESVVVGVCQEMLDTWMSGLYPVFDVIHEMGAIALQYEVKSSQETRETERSAYSNLFCPCDSTKDDFPESTLLERAIGDAADNLISFLDYSDTPMISIEDESRNILSRHLRQLALKDVLQASEYDRRGQRGE